MRLVNIPPSVVGTRMELQSEARRIRLRAQKVRSIAAQDGHQRNRELLQRVAKSYERIARDAETREAGPLGSSR